MVRNSRGGEEDEKELQELAGGLPTGSEKSDQDDIIRNTDDVVVSDDIDPADFFDPEEFGIRRRDFRSYS